jgi:CubicO group peptidase (beta-lactamase class C family)
MKKLLVLGMLSCAATSFAADPLPRAKPEAVGMSSARLALVTAALQADVDQGRIPGAVVAVARQGKLVYYEAVGWRDKDAGAKMTRDAIFSIASMTKPMVSVGLMQMFEEGRVMVTDPVGKYLPMLGNMRVAASLDSPGNTVPAQRQMTVQDILRHTSGLLYGGRGSSALHKMYPASSGVSGTTLTGPEFLAKLASLPLAYQPGKVWDYSLSVDVAGLVVEAASGKGLGNYLRERIWQPLGMTDTSFNIPAEKQNRYARWFPNDPETGKPQAVLDLTRPLKFECGGGCGASTAGDYLRFSQMLLDQGTLGSARILGRKTLEYMTADHLTPDVDNRITAVSPALADHGFGLGFAVRRSDGMAGTIGSAGEYFWSGAYGTYFWVDPKERLVVVLMSHTPGLYRGTLRAKVGALVLQALEREQRKKGA